MPSPVPWQKDRPCAIKRTVKTLIGRFAEGGRESFPMGTGQAVDLIQAAPPYDPDGVETFHLMQRLGSLVFSARFFPFSGKYVAPPGKFAPA